MNTNRILITVFLLGLGRTSQAQNSYGFGVLPAINFNKGFNKGWTINFKTESRQLYSSGNFGEGISEYDYVLTDFTTIGAKKVGLNSRLALGYLFRLEGGNIVNRFIQQYNITQRFSRFRLSHRFVTDQTISPAEDLEFRLRYRLASEIPLNGESADQGEFYLKCSNEYLQSLQSNTYDLEIRFVPLLGYIFSPKHKPEFGLDYRVKGFVNQNANHSFWTNINWFIEI
ncbi:MAG: DUF2490 domain-containing protein [Crocinitomicaceae bacterium]|nr:DUF2490 domain-containing protein [Crocinitomicaceae bacterium]